MNNNSRKLSEIVMADRCGVSGRRMLNMVLLLALVPDLLMSQGRSLTLEEAVKLGLENSKYLRISQAKVDAAEARSSEAYAAQLPGLKVAAGYTRLSEVDPFRVLVPFSATPITISPVVLNSYSARVTLQQPLFTGFRLHGLARSADLSAEAFQRDYQMEQLDVVFNVKSAYWSLYKAIEVKKVVDENIEQVKTHLRDVENFLKQGLATKNDLLKVEVQLSSAELLGIEAKNAVEVARISLNMQLGLPLNTSVTPATEIAHEEKVFPSPQDLVSSAFTHRPDMIAQDVRVKAADALVTASKGNWFPQISLVGNYYYSRPNPRILPTLDRFKDTWDVGVNLQWDLWNWGQTGAQATQAEAQYTQASIVYEQLKDAVELEVTRDYLNLEQAREKITVAGKGKSQAEENYRVTQERFRQGVATNSDLLDAEVALLQAKTNYTQALVDYELSQAKLEQSLGTQ
jgi:outer membrane protein